MTNVRIESVLYRRRWKVSIVRRRMLAAHTPSSWAVTARIARLAQTVCKQLSVSGGSQKFATSASRVPTTGNGTHGAKTGRLCGLCVLHEGVPVASSDAQDGDLLTEADVERFAKSGERRLRLSVGTIVTPLAASRAAELGIEIDRG